MNPFGIHEPWIEIAKNKIIFEQYRMALNQDKYDIEISNDNAIKRNQLFFDFMQWTFDQLDGLYFCEIFLHIDVIMKDKLREHSAAKIEKINRKKVRNKKKEGTYKPSPKQNKNWEQDNPKKSSYK